MCIRDRDQSGGSTPAALHLYGIDKDAYSGPEEMFDLVHQVRTRIITSPSFDGERVMGAILFENTMNRQVEGSPTGDYLWNSKVKRPGFRSEVRTQRALNPDRECRPSQLLRECGSRGPLARGQRSQVPSTSARVSSALPPVQIVAALGHLLSPEDSSSGDCHS